MRKKIAELLLSIPIVINILKIFPPMFVKLKQFELQKNLLRQYIYSYYDKNSLDQKRFYNIGAGNQRSSFDFWSYIDLKHSDYDKSGIDIFYDLESLKPLPLERDIAEVVFSSFVMEHISGSAIENMCKESFRILKKGGVFHSKVHCYEYSYRLLKHGLFSPVVPFECRESRELISKFIKRHKGRVVADFNDLGEYVVKSIKKPEENVKLSAYDAFIYFNATTAVEKISSLNVSVAEVINNIDKGNAVEFYNKLKNHYIDQEKKKPHQHNADYYPKEELLNYIKNLGFSDVYFTQPYQSVSPALWEDSLNIVHKGFTFSIEAIK